MINFKNIYKLSYEQSKHLKKLKILQLSVQVRSELRGKIAHYFARIPEEDKILLEH